MKKNSKKPAARGVLNMVEEAKRSMTAVQLGFFFFFFFFLLFDLVFFSQLFSVSCKFPALFSHCGRSVWYVLF
jgi:hypothetical protein